MQNKFISLKFTANELFFRKKILETQIDSLLITNLRSFLTSPKYCKTERWNHSFQTDIEKIHVIGPRRKTFQRVKLNSLISTRLLWRLISVIFIFISAHLRRANFRNNQKWKRHLRTKPQYSSHTVSFISNIFFTFVKLMKTEDENLLTVSGKIKKFATGFRKWKLQIQ